MCFNQMRLWRNNYEFILTAFGQGMSLITSFIFLKLVSYYAPVEEYGLYSLALSIAAFVALFPFSSFDQAIARYVSIFHIQQTYAKNYSNTLLLYSVIFLLLLVVFFLGYGFDIIMIPENIQKILISLIFFSCFNIFKTMLWQIENFNRNRSLVMNSKIFEGVSRISILLLILFFGEISANSILWINSFVFICNIFYIIILNRYSLVWEGCDMALLRLNFSAYIKFSSPLLIWAVFSWMQIYIPIWFLNHYASTVEVGHFTMLSTIATIIPTQIIGILSSYITPILYQKEQNNQGYTRNVISKLFIPLSLLFVGVGIGMFVYKEWIILLLSSPQYLEYSMIMPYLYMSSCFANIAVIGTYQFFTYQETAKLFFPQIFPSLIGLLVAYIVIPSFGIVGAVYTSLSISISYFILVAIYYSIYNPPKMKEKQ